MKKFLGERLHQILVGTGRKSLLNLFNGGLGGDHHDLDMGEQDIRADCTEQFVPVHDGHVPVNKHEVDVFSMVKAFDSLLAITGFENVKLKLPEQLAQDHSNHLGVVYD